MQDHDIDALLRAALATAKASQAAGQVAKATGHDRKALYARAPFPFAALPLGEIDLVCKRGGVVAFVEVKWRKSAAELDHAIDEYRLSRVAAAAEAVAHEYATEGEDIRIDVLLLAPGGFPRHIVNAWQP